MARQSIAALTQENAGLRGLVGELQVKLDSATKASDKKALIGNALMAASVLVATAMLYTTREHNSEASQRQASSEIAQDCAQWDQRALQALRLNPSSAEQIFATIEEQNRECEAAGIPLLASVSFKIAKEPTGISQEVRAKAADVVKAVTRKAQALPGGAKKSIYGSDRYSLGDNQIPGFDVRGGPKVTRFRLAENELGGRLQHLSQNELDLPESNEAEAGIRPSFFTDGSSRKEIQPRPKVDVGVGTAWNSPFGPIRIDFTKLFMNEAETKVFRFDAGSQF